MTLTNFMTIGGQSPSSLALNWCQEASKTPARSGTKTINGIVASLPSGDMMMIYFSSDNFVGSIFLHMKYTILVCDEVNEENVANVLNIMKAKSLYILG